MTHYTHECTIDFAIDTPFDNLRETPEAMTEIEKFAQERSVQFEIMNECGPGGGAPEVRFFTTDRDGDDIIIGLMSDYWQEDSDTINADFVFVQVDDDDKRFKMQMREFEFTREI